MWARCTYACTYATIAPLIEVGAREKALYWSAFEALHTQLRHEEGVSIAEAITIAHLLAAFHRTISGWDQLFHNCSVVLNEIVEWSQPRALHRVLTHVCTRMQRSEPQCATLSELLFQAYVHDALDIKRRRRINAANDRHAYVCLNVLFAYYAYIHDRAGIRHALLERSTFDAWVLHVARHADARSGIYDTIRDFGVDMNGAQECVDHFQCDVQDLQWFTPKKRKRAATERLVPGDCAICFDSTTVVETQCKHHFCADCLTKWNKSTCPLCRQRLIPAD